MPRTKIRLSFRPENGGTKQVALCIADYNAIVKIAGSKLKLGKRVMARARLVVESTGVELLHNDPNLQKSVQNGSVIIVHISSGKEEKNPKESKVYEEDLPPFAPSLYDKSNKSKLDNDTAREKDKSSPEAANNSQENVPAAKLFSPLPNNTNSSRVMTNLEFHCTYPILDGNILPLVRECISGNPSFTESNFGNYLAFDYKDVASINLAFPNPWQSGQHFKAKEKWMMSLRRECRGLLLCSHTGRVLRRAFHKFFSINEVAETNQDAIDVLSLNDVVLLEKIDGSLVSPLILMGSFEIQWATRKALQSDLKDFCEKNSKHSDYIELARYCIEKNQTPLFEWCVAGKSVGVIKHEETSLILLAIRDMVTGEYAIRSEVEAIARQFQVPCVQPFNKSTSASQEMASSHVGTLSELVGQIKAEPAPLEGVVAILNNGQSFLKIKTLWYVSMVSASKSTGAANPWAFLVSFLQNLPSLKGVPSERIWKTSLSYNSSLDDSCAFCMSLLSNSKEQVEQFQRFLELCNQVVHQLHSELCEWSSRLRDKVANHGFNLEIAIEMASINSGWSKNLLRAYVSDLKISTTTLRHELIQLPVDNLRKAFGFYWSEAHTCVVEGKGQALKAVVQATDVSPDLKCKTEDRTRYILRSRLFAENSLDRPPKGLQNHVCSEYLLRKVANYLGKPKAVIMDETVLEIRDNYLRSEGKLKGLWEKFAKKNIVDLRIDLQPQLGNSVTEHNGTNEWALLLVQYGPSAISKNSSKVKEGLPRGSFSGIFIQTNYIHRYVDIRKAMERSFEERRLVFLTSQNGILKVPDLAKADERRYMDPNTVDYNNATNNIDTSWTIYVDLDGVLADFDGALVSASGKRSGDFENANAMWRFIMSTERSFFARLPWTEHGKEIWNFLQTIQQTEDLVRSIKILTGVPPAKNGKKNITRQKRTWCIERLDEDIAMIACSSSEKYKWSGERRILIDDLLLHKEKWENSGGTFLHYAGNFGHLKRQLQTLVLQNGGLTREEEEAIFRLRGQAAKHEAKYELEDSKIHYVKGSEEAKDQIFADTVKLLSNDDIGIDCEWRPDELKQRSGIYSAASVIQVSIRGITFVIDTHCVSSVTRQSLVNLFSPPEQVGWKLIFFGIEEDLCRIIAAIPEIAMFHNKEFVAPFCVDLQRICTIFGLATPGKNLISLSDVVLAVIGHTLVKDRSVQAGDWSKRPLSSPQIYYAAYDAHICLIIWKAILTEECLHHAVLTSMVEPLVIPSKRSLQRYSRENVIETSIMNKKQNETIVLANPASILSAPPFAHDKVTVIRKNTYTALFLTKEAAKALLEAFPPRHRNVFTDHVTLTYAPNTDSLVGLPIGKNCKIYVSQIISDNKSQVARVTFMDDTNIQDFMKNSQTAHITMSTAVNVPTSRSSVLLNDYKETGIDQIVVMTADIILDGIVGLKVDLTEDQTMLQNVSKPLLRKVIHFAEQKVPGSTLKFRGGMLYPSERYAIHSFCENRGILSRSEGPKDNRKLTLSFPKFLNESECDISNRTKDRIVQSANDLDEQKLKKANPIRRRDARNISKSYVCISMDVFSLIDWDLNDIKQNCSAIKPIGELRSDGHVGQTGPNIHLDPERFSPDNSESDEFLLRSLILGDKLPTEISTPLVVVMRGLPGSGKSSFAMALKQQYASEDTVAILSADGFFEEKGSFAFDKSKLDDAHDFCRKCFVKELLNERRAAVIVDNTNSKIADYKFYVEKARQTGKRFLIVEMLCRSEIELQDFYHRGLHRVPMQTMGRMRARWENDQNSLPFISTGEFVDAQGKNRKNESLRSWLTQNHMFHNTKAREKLT